MCVYVHVCPWELLDRLDGNMWRMRWKIVYTNPALHTRPFDIMKSFSLCILFRSSYPVSVNVWPRSEHYAVSPRHYRPLQTDIFIHTHIYKWIYYSHKKCQFSLFSNDKTVKKQKSKRPKKKKMTVAVGCAEKPAAPGAFYLLFSVYSHCSDEPRCSGGGVYSSNDVCVFKQQKQNGVLDR